MLEVDVQGFEKAINNLKKVGQEIRRKSIRNALLTSANVFKKEVIKNASQLDNPDTPEKIAANIATKFDGKYYKTSKNIKYSVGVRGGATSKKSNESNKGGNTFYWRFLEFGTKNMPAKPFFSRAFYSKANEAMKVFINKMNTNLDREIKKL